MSELKDAAENIKRLSVQFKGLLALADHIEKIESIEGDLPQIEAKRDALVAECKDLADKSVQLQDSIFLSQQQSKSVMDAAHKEAADINIKALEEAEQLIEKAKSEAADKVLAIAQEYNQTADKVKEATDKLISLQTQCAEEQLKLEQIQQQLAAIKGAI